MWELVTGLTAEGVTVVLTRIIGGSRAALRPHRDHNHGDLIANKPTRELVGMAREKIVSITVDKDIAGADGTAFLKAEVVEPRRIDITYNRDATSAGQVLALVQCHGYAIEDVTTRPRPIWRMCSCSDGTR